MEEKTYTCHVIAQQFTWPSLIRLSYSKYYMWPQSMKAILSLINEVFYDNEFNRIALLANIGGLTICYIIWTQLIQHKQTDFFTPYGVYPMQVVAVIWLMHLIISVYSFKIDKHISNLLIAAPILYSILIFILEIYYWNSL